MTASLPATIKVGERVKLTPSIHDSEGRLMSWEDAKSRLSFVANWAPFDGDDVGSVVHNGDGTITITAVSTGSAIVQCSASYKSPNTGNTLYITAEIQLTVTPAD